MPPVLDPFPPAASQHELYPLQFSLGQIHQSELMVPFPRTAVCPPVLPVTLLCTRCLQSEQHFLEQQCPESCTFFQIVSQETLITC